eukprot:12911293-Prorocentrum_lima.AAC.1
MASSHMGPAGYWKGMVTQGFEPPLWPIGPEFWMLIEQNPDMDHPVLAAALADEVTRMTRLLFFQPAVLEDVG